MAQTNLQNTSKVEIREVKNTFKHFIFDLDGTLLDTIPDLTLLTNDILKALGCPEHTQEEILSYVGSGVRRLIYLALPPDSDPNLQEEAMDLWNANFHKYYQHTAPFAGIPAMLDVLHSQGITCGVVSNKLQAGVDQILQQCLPNRFQVMFGESPSIPRKPDPTGLNLAMQIMGAAPIDTVYIGDSPGDIVAGHNAHLFSIACLWGYHKREDFDTEGIGCPDLFITKPENLLALASNQ